jgi:hypothetical protein
MTHIPGAITVVNQRYQVQALNFILLYLKNRMLSLVFCTCRMIKAAIIAEKKFISPR